MRWECRERFPDPTSNETTSSRSRHASRHAHDSRAVMHVGIANPQWREKRSRHSRHMQNPQLHVSGKRPILRNMVIYSDVLTGPAICSVIYSQLLCLLLKYGGERGCWMVVSGIGLIVGVPGLYSILLQTRILLLPECRWKLTTGWMKKVMNQTHCTRYASCVSRNTTCSIRKEIPDNLLLTISKKKFVISLVKSMKLNE